MIKLFWKSLNQINQAKNWLQANKLTMNSDKIQQLLITDRNRTSDNTKAVKFLSPSVDPHL